jgi:outer membrane protein assembly factor BamA
MKKNKTAPRISLIGSGLLILFLFSGNLTGANQNEKEKRVKILPVPSIGYSPETKTYLGVVSLFTLSLYPDLETRTSNAKIELNYTWNKQLIAESEWSYFFEKEYWFTKGSIHFSDYPDLYYGIGSQTSEINELSFDSKRFLLELSVLKNLNKNWFLGPATKYLNYSDIEFNNEISDFPELYKNSNFAFGFHLIKDTRNSILTPTSGFYLFLSEMNNFSETNYQELTIDVRLYKSWKNLVWANRVLNDFTFGTPPFYDFSYLGGDKIVRGYYYGRFRDNHLSTWQSEIRFPVYKRLFAAVFAGISNLYSNQNRFSLQKTKPNYGMGIRFLVDKSENTFLRIDYALGEKRNNGFYISFGESF